MIVVLAAVMMHLSLFATSSGFRAWVVYIVPIIAGLIAILAILTVPSDTRHNVVR